MLGGQRVQEAALGTSEKLPGGHCSRAQSIHHRGSLSTRTCDAQHWQETNPSAARIVGCGWRCGQEGARLALAVGKAIAAAGHQGEGA